VNNNKRAFTETKIYPIVFMILVAAIFGAILSVFYHATKEKVALHAELRLKTAILSLFDLPQEDVEISYLEHIKEKQIAGLDYYVAVSNDSTLGYCFHVTGSGMWGTITALLALDTDFKEIIGLTILDQNETPGLGGRITEEKFQSQFSGKKIRENQEIVYYRLIDESEQASELEINQITGATSSSKAVVDIIYENLQNIIFIIAEKDDKYYE